MKEFIEKLIGRLEEKQAEAENEMHRLRSGDYTLPCSYDITDIKEIASESFKESIQIVNELAEEYNGWIPCSERLPKEKGFYIVTQEIYSFDGKRLLRTVTKADTLFNPVNQKWNISDNLKVIAWQPLPEPYKS